MTLTIYEVVYEFFTFAFPSAVLTQFEDPIDLTVFVLTYFVIFGFILIPLWRMATFFWRKAK
jgi:hypothetical protein